MSLGNWLTPTNGLLLGSGALILVLVFLILRQRQDAGYGRRIKKQVAGVLSQMGCKVKGGRVSCSEHGGIQGLGENFKLDKAVDRSIDQFCELLKASEEPEQQPPAQAHPTPQPQMHGGGFHDMQRAPMPTSMPMMGGGGVNPMAQGYQQQFPVGGMPQMQPMQPQFAQGGFGGEFNPQPQMPQQAMPGMGYMPPMSPMMGGGGGMPMGGMMDPGSDKKPLPFVPISTREDRGGGIGGGGGGMGMGMGMGAGGPAPQYNPQVY
jgi:hypothetical protein